MEKRPETTEGVDLVFMRHGPSVYDSGYSTACSNSISLRSPRSSQSNSGSSNSDSSVSHRNYQNAPDGQPPKDKVVKKQPPVQPPSVNGFSMEIDEDSVANNSPRTFPETFLKKASVTLNAFNRNCAEKTEEPPPTPAPSPRPVPQAVLNTSKIIPASASEEEFCLVVSMTDGQVLYTTPSLTTVLGFPKDMWLGRSFIDFIHPKDKVAFANHITTGVANPSIISGVSSKSGESLFFCCLRKYRGLKTTGFGIKNKEVQYIPVQLTLTFKEATGECQDIFLVINVVVVKTAYKEPKESFCTPTFSTRQTCDCVISQIDAGAVSYLGYLPQDIIGRSVFDFYHPDDMLTIKDMYKTILEGHTAPGIVSQPYKFRTQNGDYVLLETEWSSFINPWSKKLEFTIGQHSVLRGPSNPDVFASSLQSPNPPFSKDKLKKAEVIQDSIKYLLRESCCPQTRKHIVSKRCKDLAMLVKNLMDEIIKPHKCTMDDLIDEHSFSASERNSVLLGEISPHHNQHDSKSSTGTPPSYSQLNYFENMQRFFQSFRSQQSKESPINQNFEKELVTSDEESIINAMSRSHSNSSVGIIEDIEKRIDKYNIQNPDPNLLLTKNLLNRHNEDMAKALLKIYKEKQKFESKSSSDRRSKTGNNQWKTTNSDKNQGVKRCGSDSWERDKSLKHPHLEAGNFNSNVNTQQQQRIPVLPLSGNNFSLWSTMPSSQKTGVTNTGIQMAGVIPVYYLSQDCQPSGNVSHSVDNSNAIRSSEDLKTIALDPSLPGTSFPPTLGMSTLIFPPMMYNQQLGNIGPPITSSSDISARPTDSKIRSKAVAENQTSASDSPLSQDEDNASKINNLARDSGTGDESSFSSFSSSMKTDFTLRSSENDSEAVQPSTRPIIIKKNPPWLENVSITPDFTLRYQMTDRDLAQVLDADNAMLKTLTQPQLVKDQLKQLYVDLELAGLSTRLRIGGHSHLNCKSTIDAFAPIASEDVADSLGYQSSSSSCGSCWEGFAEEDDVSRPACSQTESEKKKSQYNYSQMVMIYEENMPLPLSSAS